MLHDLVHHKRKCLHWMSKAILAYTTVGSLKLSYSELILHCRSVCTCCNATSCALNATHFSSISVTFFLLRPHIVWCRCPLPSARQHPSYRDCFEVKREYYQNCYVLDVRHNVHSQQHTYVSSSYRCNRLGLSHWDPCAVHCIEVVPRVVLL